MDNPAAEVAEAVGARAGAAGDEAEVAARERAQLVRLCGRLTGDVDAAEDLAQETLYEAWRNAHKLRDASGRPAWLAAIARNICLRWARSRGREVARRALPRQLARPDDAAVPDHGLDPALGDVPDEFNLEVELERGELVALLDRAMALLPPDTRRILLERYVQETPQAETALRLGLSEGAVAMKLQRGKLALRRLLTTEFLREAVAHGLVDGPSEQWQETRLWCSLCGRRRLVGYLSPDRDEFWLRCPGCDNHHWTAAPRAGLTWHDLKGFRPILARQMTWLDLHYRRALSTRVFPCPGCGRTLRPWLHQRSGDDPYDVAFQARCGACGASSEASHSWLALCLPEGRRFYREHQRIRYAGHRHVHVGPSGGPALITSFESLTSRARLDVISAWDSFEVLDVFGGPTEQRASPSPDSAMESGGARNAAKGASA
jgi:RNA polymerase sigma-70 factor (ECF subfamily)